MGDMKTLFAGIILIVVIGLAGFFFRNVLEHPSAPAGMACTLEAKICPDGTTVGRIPPSCDFAVCAAPNVSLDAVGIAFALPAGYRADAVPAGDPALIAAYLKSATTTDSAAITIRRYPVTAGSTTQEVMLAHTLLEPSDMPPKDMSAFSPIIIGTRTFSEITLERFEGVVSTAYFLPRKDDVLEFEVVEHNIKDWNNPKLITDNLAEHQALLKMLGTLEIVGE
jgi:hypothetical protein